MTVDYIGCKFWQFSVSSIKKERLFLVVGAS